MDVIPSLDLLDGAVVRLRRGDFADRTVYGEPAAVLDMLDVPRGSRIHIVDLAGSRDGKPVALDVVRRLSSRGLRVQAGDTRSVLEAFKPDEEPDDGTEPEVGAEVEPGVEEGTAE